MITRNGTANGARRASLSPESSLLEPEQLEMFCREVSEPITFALTRLIDARRKFERGAQDQDALTAVSAARSGIEHAARLIAELYVRLRTRDATEGLELAQLVETVLELLDPELRSRVVVRRNQRQATPVLSRRAMLARALMTSLLDALGRTYDSDESSTSDVDRDLCHAARDEVFDVRPALPDPERTPDSHQTQSHGLDSWTLILDAHGGRVGIESSPDGQNAKVCLRCPGGNPPKR
jgi:hypothetical protein